MATLLGYDPKFMNILKTLYSNEDYIKILRDIKENMSKIYKLSSPQFDDIEAEILCLLLLHFKPKIIYEFSPCGGWSTMYILNSLFLSGNTSARVNSYDIHDTSCKLINKFEDLSSIWNFHLGNVLDEFNNFDFNMDYLFIDSDHSKEFAENYVNNLLEPLLTYTRQNNRKIICSVHDVFHSTGVKIPSEEGEVVINFLNKYNLSYFSPNNLSHSVEIEDIRYSKNLVCPNIHVSYFNPAIFFILE